MEQDSVKRLEARIVELEGKLQTVTSRPSASDVSADEIKAYVKVRDMISADFGDFCGVNDCFRLRCSVGGGSTGTNFRCIVRCINECVCGPCITACITACFSGQAGAGGQFGGFGG